LTVVIWTATRRAAAAPRPAGDFREGMSPALLEGELR
jgi:hypothetical protein